MINVKITQSNRLRPRITVVGVGGGGGNAVNNMIHSGLEGCEFLVCNTDAQALEGNAAAHKVQLGVNVTRGLGAGANPEIGRAAAEESIEEILSYLDGANMVFVTAGMGGGTGTGAAAVVARAAREAGILTIGVVTKPFHFEGTHRMKLAENGIAELQKHVDTLIVIPNQNLFRIANEKTTFSDAFRMADDVLQSGVRGVTDLMVMPGQINLDFADVRAVMAEMGKAMMGMGDGEGERRAIMAAEKAISNPLLEGVEIKGARGVLINVIGGSDLTLFEIDEAVNRIRDEVDPDANIIFGSTLDESLNGRMRVSVVATGIDVAGTVQARPIHLSQAVEQSRRPVATGMQPRAQSPQQGGYAGYAVERAVIAERTARGGADFGAGSIPPSIIPSQANAGMRPTASAGYQPVATAGYQPVATAPAQPMAQKTMTTTAGAGVAETMQQPGVGHTAAATYAPAATARKLEEADDVSATWTKPAVTQSYQRSVPPLTQQPAPGQPRATRIGDNFIPPKPVDPRAMQAPTPGGDLFGETEAPVAAPVAKAPPAPKKSPSLFERFTLQREKETPAAAPARSEPASSRLSVEDGGKEDEDELDIPAFLRRQAN